MKSTPGLLVRDWKQDVVNLIQFPRTHTIVSPSPFALKLETWLRINKLSYNNVSNDFTKTSAKGQIPFVEVNGRQFADSNHIIDTLASLFNLSIDKNLNTKERAEARAITILIEESLFRCLQYDRGHGFEWVSTDKGFLPYFSGIKKILYQKIFAKKLISGIKRTVTVQGYGRHSEEEINEIAKKDLSALSTFLGDKRYLFGDRPSTVDATLFGHLVQFTDPPLHSDKIKPFMEQNTPNLVEFIKRMKADFWPDWDTICEHLVMNPTDAKHVTTTTTVITTTN
ncbi:outer mitochondrial membrane transport complex protein [Ditylenchus destructor]|nr:outer mitochondrial membrane transport complex protein [Ditylenchus destructor]